MAKKAVPFVRQVFVFVLTAAIVFALLKWYKDQSEGFQTADRTFNILVKYTSASANITDSTNNTNIAPPPGFNATITGGKNQIDITGIPTSLGKLKDVKISHIPTGVSSIPALTSTQYASPNPVPNGVTLFDRGATNVVLETTAGKQIRTPIFASMRPADFAKLDANSKLPLQLSSFRIRNLGGTAAFGTINTASNILANVKISLTFGP